MNPHELRARVCAITNKWPNMHMECDTDIVENDIIELIKLVREETVEECAKIADKSECKSCFLEYGLTQDINNIDCDEIATSIRRLAEEK